MKLSDVKAATALVIQGYLRSQGGGTYPESWYLEECLGAIKAECDDWGEGLEAVAPERIEVDLNVPRTPYNLRRAMQALADELKDLDGSQAVVVFS